MTKPPTKRTADELLKQIHDGLAVLGLGEVRSALDAALAEPIKDETRLEWLWRIVEPQLRRRIENRTERRIRAAKLPVRKTLEAFDFAFQAKLDKDLVMELATLRFIAQGKNVLLAGMSGTGKSHIALALALLACTENRRVLYTTSADMLAKLQMSLADHTLTKALKPYIRAELLVIDEVGLEQVERGEALRSGLLQKVLLPRYNHQRSSIITSNIPWDGWATTSAITSVRPRSSIASSITVT
jgi:DNA replication protein DnaC